MNKLGQMLENFDGIPATGEDRSDGTTLTPDELENVRLAAFDNGYRAGWDDATAALEAEQRTLAADLAQNLRSLTFAYEDASRHVVRSMVPLIREIVEKVLPASARETIGRHVENLIADRAAALVDAPLEIVVSPADEARVTACLPQDTGHSVTVRVEPSLAAGQADLRFGTEETALDLVRVAAEITRAIEGLIDTIERDAPHARAG